MDVVNEVLWKDLDQIVLVGHSYGGMVAAGVAEKIRETISSIIYLDAFVPESDMSFSDFNPNWSEHGPMVKVPTMDASPSLSIQEKATQPSQGK